MWKTGRWVWVPQHPIPNEASRISDSKFSDDRINPHLLGKTDTYIPSYHASLRRQGIIPPLARQSGSKIFKSKRRTSPNASRVSKPNSASKIYSEPRRNLRSNRPQATQRRQLSRRPAPTMQTRSSGRLLEEQLALIKPSSPPPNAPKAPLADRLQEMQESFGNMEVASTIPPALPAPFRNHISENVCTHYLCPIGEVHPEGLYLHEGKLSSKPHGYFGAANPPPWIMQAYERVKKGNGEASEMDYINLQYFGRCHPPHFELIFQWGTEADWTFVER